MCIELSKVYCSYTFLFFMLQILFVVKPQAQTSYIQYEYD